MAVVGGCPPHQHRLMKTKAAVGDLVIMSKNHCNNVCSCWLGQNPNVGSDQAPKKTTCEAMDFCVGLLWNWIGTGASEGQLQLQRHLIFCFLPPSGQNPNVDPDQAPKKSTCEAMDFALCFFGIGSERVRARARYSCKGMSFFVSFRHLVRIRMWVQIKPTKKLRMHRNCMRIGMHWKCILEMHRKSTRDT